MKRFELKNIISVQERISNLEGVKCHLTHERVRFDKDTKLPIPHSLDECSFQRLNLCPMEIRTKRLACGHTDVRNFLKEVLYSMTNYKEFDHDEILNLYNDLEKLDNEICALDHRKGFAEMDYAVKIDKVDKNNNSEKEIKKILEDDVIKEKNTIREIELQHDKYVDSMVELRDKILSVLDKTIKIESKKIKHRLLF